MAKPQRLLRRHPRQHAVGFGSGVGKSLTPCFSWSKVITTPSYSQQARPSKGTGRAQEACGTSDASRPAIANAEARPRPGSSDARFDVSWPSRRSKSARTDAWCRRIGAQVVPGFHWPRTRRGADDLTLRHPRLRLGVGAQMVDVVGRRGEGARLRPAASPTHK